MGRTLIFDTGVLIAADRGMLDFDPVDIKDDAAIAAITVHELMLGAELSEGRNRAKRQGLVDFVLETFPVMDYTVDIARTHTKLAMHARRTGAPRGAHDLIIAATAATTNSRLVTTDKAARFGDLPGVKCLVLEQQQ